MDTRTQNSHLPFPTRKREPKFAKFVLEPGDEDLIAQLPAEQQAALRSEGSYVERAQQMGVAIGTVRSRLHRARAALTQLREKQRTAKSESDPLH